MRATSKRLYRLRVAAAMPTAMSILVNSGTDAKPVMSRRVGLHNYGSTMTSRASPWSAHTRTSPASSVTQLQHFVMLIATADLAMPLMTCIAVRSAMNATVVTILPAGGRGSSITTFRRASR